MKSLGNLFRSILNINTVWGLMILSAFLLCVVQHYLPTTTPLPEDQLLLGHNTLTITIEKDGGDDAKPAVYEFDIIRTEDSIVLPPPEADRKQSRPRLIDAHRVNKAFLLKWDFGEYGSYRMAVNGTVVKKGLLVTLQGLSDAAIGYASFGFDIALGLVSTMVLFLGLMKVGEDAGIVQIAAKVLYPIIRLLFPQVPKDHPANGAILMNVTTSILGLGNAATPFGLKAIKELETLNPHPGVATDAQIMLMAYNTAGLALIPTTLIAVRKAAGCSDPFEIIGTCMVTGAVSTIVAICMVKLLGKLPFFTVKAALAEGDETASTAAAAHAADDAATVGEEDDR